MKISEIEIYNVRGIKEVILQPKGKNLVICGPNGAGKSAVVDAIDFLLTGRILRLTGHGTGDITLKEHGAHIDIKDIKKVLVKAKILLPGIKEEIAIERCLATPNKPVYDKQYAAQLEPILDAADSGQYVLTRREILRYIATDPGTRSKEIQALLHIDEIESIRKNLVKIKNNFDTVLNARRETLRSAEAAITITVQQTRFEEEKILMFVNENLVILNKSPLTEVSSKALLGVLQVPERKDAKTKINTEMLDKDIENINETIAKNQEEMNKLDASLREKISKLKEDAILLRALNVLSLTEFGLSLLDESGTCPLCDTQWTPEKLKEHLLEKKAMAAIAESSKKEITGLAAKISNVTNFIQPSIIAVIDASEMADLKDKVDIVRNWNEQLCLLKEALEHPIEKYPVTGIESDKVRCLMITSDIEKTLIEFSNILKTKFPPKSKEESALDKLTRLDENLKAYESSVKEYNKAHLNFNRATILFDSFEKAKETVLSQLYDKVNIKFVNLYKDLHGEDEKGFNAHFNPDGAGLKFDVDFHGRGNHPPNALHSEGHQDSMGICLYLTLAEQLNGNLINLVVLDDVVMSVDSGHRKELCRILKKNFSDKQFIITTHDRAWANQLQHDGVVNHDEKIEFYNWNINTGPKINLLTDVDKRIEKDIQENHIPDAAAKLRRFSEEFFAIVCNNLGVPVVFKLDGSWELGELILPAQKSYVELIKESIKSAESWGNAELAVKLKEVDSTRTQIYQRIATEQWVVNTSVHYNNWENFEPKEFRTVADAFKDLFGLFRCSQCNGIIKLIQSDSKKQAVKCNCGKINWNLIKNPSDRHA